KLCLPVNRGDVQGDVLRRGLEELRHGCLREPDGIVLETAGDTGLAVLGAVEDKLAGAFGGDGRGRVAGHSGTPSELRSDGRLAIGRTQRVPLPTCPTMIWSTRPSDSFWTARMSARISSRLRIGFGW